MKLFCFGIGYSAETLIRLHGERFVSISGTVRTQAKAERLKAMGVNALVHAGGEPGPQTRAALAAADRLLVSAAPDEAGDPMLRQLGAALERAEDLAVVVYLSTVGVYGDHGGAWIDEDTPLKATSERGKRRVAAEEAWAAFGAARGITVQRHRLAGIYGPAAARSMISARARRGASSRRGRSSTASMSKISPARRSRASSILRSQGPSMSATTSPVRRRMWSRTRPRSLAWSRRARCRLRRRSSPKWRAASMRRTSAAPTGGSRNGSATAFAIRPTARGWPPSRRPADSGVLGGCGVRLLAQAAQFFKKWNDSSGLDFTLFA